jgi:hypothetical protein
VSCTPPRQTISRCHGRRNNSKPLDDHGHPTRATEAEWLCHFSPDNAYRACVRTEPDSALAQIGLIDTAQHVDEFPEFEDQWDWVMLCAEFGVRHMLALWRVDLLGLAFPRLAGQQR